MSKTEFSIEPQYIRMEIMQNIIDLLLYNEKASKEIIKVVNKYPKPYTMEELKGTNRVVRTVKLDNKN
jgi:hypothetical protein